MTEFFIRFGRSYKLEADSLQKAMEEAESLLDADVQRFIDNWGTVTGHFSVLACREVS